MTDNKADALVEAAIVEHRTFHYEPTNGLLDMSVCKWGLCAALRDFMEQEPVAWRCDGCGGGPHDYPPPVRAKGE